MLIRRHLFTLFFYSFFCSVASGQKKATDDGTYLACIIEYNASYRTGAKAWEDSLYKKLNKDVAKQNGAPPRTYIVTVRFLIVRDGSIDSVRALTHHGYGMEQEAERIIRQAPKWSPAFKRGRYASEWKEQQIIFTVAETPSTYTFTEPDHIHFPPTDDTAQLFSLLTTIL